jgi:hypothetical protein
MGDAAETAIGTSPVLKILGGAAMPANVATADAGTVLATANLPSDWMTAASSGTKDKSGTWQDASADASGYARYFRIYANGGTPCHYQGLVSQAWQASTAYVLNQHVSNGGNVYICTTAGTSASSGGPSGTGTGIADGTAVWAYVGVADLVLDNTNIAAGQSVTINTYQWVVAGA